MYIVSMRACSRVQRAFGCYLPGGAVRGWTRGRFALVGDVIITKIGKSRTFVTVRFCILIIASGVGHGRQKTRWIDSCKRDIESAG